MKHGPLLGLPCDYCAAAQQRPVKELNKTRIAVQPGWHPASPAHGRHDGNVSAARKAALGNNSLDGAVLEIAPINNHGLYKRSLCTPC